MITKRNFKALLETIGFVSSGDGVYSKTYGDMLDNRIVVDFDKESISWPKGLRKGDDTTSNFSATENFVVLECVNRLLEKGYRPEHIVLEEKWQLGHEQKGGKADICVYSPDNTLLVIIECKTAGDEFRKYRKQLFADGGQLFSYWQQDKSAQWLCLYASDLVEKRDGDKTSNVVEYENSIVVINCSDDPNMEKTAASDDSVHLYSQASSVAQLFEVWDVTYNKQTCPDVIFGKDSQAYNIGIRRLRKQDLRSFSRDDGIVNRFEEILRHNNVSDKENAFNKLVSLFICKLVDEITKGDEDELDFQYRVGSDDFESLQDRLQRLHRDGMLQFMNEKIFYVENDYAERLFSQYSRSDRNNAIQDLQATIRKLKFYSNNEFAFKDVHNEELFLQNSKILVEMVQLFEPYRIVYPARDQLLGDLFEQLLAKGFKQNEGQFFTAMPLTRFIWESLPLDTIVRRGGKLVHPRMIDYACGAGHFLTEGVEAINAFFKDECGKAARDNSWVEKFVYGVEKDYRLARVSKVSLHMNGAGAGQIVFGDGLENYPEKGIEAGRFSILVANPPYSVDAFKAHLRLRNNKFMLLDYITDQGSEIEALFVERAAQLLKPRGVAAIILPASILTGPGAYVGAREQLIDNFKIRAIVALGKKAFQATNTETIILFLEKYDEPPCRAALVVDSVNAIISGKSLEGWEEKDILDGYLAQIGVSEHDYARFISRDTPWTGWLGHDYFGLYAKVFSELTEIKSLKAKGWFNKLDASQQESELSGRFYEWCLGTGGTEREKLCVFGLVYGQKTLIVKSPDDKTEERKFLGYSWSDRRRQEGIQIETPGGMLYNDATRRAPGTIAAGIRQSFADETPLITNGEEYAKFVPLKDLIDFSRPKFDKAISVEKSNEFKVESRFPLVPIANCAKIIRGVTYAKEDQVSDETDKVILTADNITLDGDFAISKKVYLRDTFVIDDEKRLCANDCFICFSSGSRQHVGKVAFIDKDTKFYAGGFMGILRAAPKTILPKYLYEVLNSDIYRIVVRSKSTGANIKNLSNEIGDIKIPLPDLTIQKKIVAECVKVDIECEAKKKIVTAKQKKIGDMINAIDNAMPSKDWYVGIVDDMLQSVVGQGSKVASKDIKSKGAIPVVSQEDGPVVSGYVDEGTPITDLPVVVFGDHSCTFKYVDFPFVRGADGTQLLKFDPSRFDAKFMCCYLRGKKLSNANSYERHMKYLKVLNVAVPPLTEQRRIVSEIEKCEKAIAEAEARIAEFATKKSAILDRFIKKEKK